MNSIKLGRDAKLVCDCRLNSFDTFLNHFDEVCFNSYKTSEYAYKNTEIVNNIIQNIFDMLEETLAPDGVIVKNSCEIVFIARNTTNGIYFDDNNIRFKIDYNAGDIIRFRRWLDTIEIKTMYN